LALKAAESAKGQRHDADGLVPAKSTGNTTRNTAIPISSNRTTAGDKITKVS